MSRTQTRREKLAEKEEAILQAATKAFLLGGLKAARMAEIAKAAQVAEGTLYLYYRNKEALFEAVVARHWDDLRRGAQKVVRAETDPVLQLETLASYTLDRIMGDRKLFELTLYLAHAGEGLTAATDRLGYVRVFDGVIERGRSEGVFTASANPKLLRDLFFGTLDYAARSALARGEDAASSRIIETLMTAMLAVLQPRAEDRDPGVEERLERAVARLEAVAERYPAG
ncbi:TetR/AcrR family transcriptional regulator [Parvularcula maris]|uniref:TetR/AcrR family transcriptional regulator n=1 Tax=Parvularcula maris TaxID=2965077 RepID=A0A9X2RJE3_9PROT|nr:TetR/AcrR family transcriptional regulator [Parvularcula maris]MCQ8184652.1 TetR/AcrR family transcriptional regulator [Parvularcula maris]